MTQRPGMSMKCSGGSSMSLGHPVSPPPPHPRPRAAWDHPPLPEGGPILCLPPRFPKAGGSYSTCDVYWNNTFQLKTPQAKGEERERGGAEPKHRLRKDPMREAWEGDRLLRAGRRLRWVDAPSRFLVGGGSATDCEADRMSFQCPLTPNGYPFPPQSCDPLDS